MNRVNQYKAVGKTPQPQDVTPRKALKLTAWIAVSVGIVVVSALIIANTTLSAMVFSDTRHGNDLTDKITQAIQGIKETNFYTAHLDNYVSFAATNPGLFATETDGDNFLNRGYTASNLLNSVASYGYSAALIPFDNLWNYALFVCILSDPISKFVDSTTYTLNTADFTASLEVCYYKAAASQTIAAADASLIAPFSRVMVLAATVPVSVGIYQQSRWQPANYSAPIPPPVKFATVQSMQKALVITYDPTS